ncbi:hypothetical protein I3842_03G107700 [Carya illinoinensis]|uniref:PGG domain-containing protein n=1 Tax=Carya illinoinensis TaxID=32201 RepID=A0A922FJC1_CARIL|nr:hypothetical protein I3842_03G107700 [Carya illinoinensis]
MMDTSHDYTVALYEASLDGSVSTLDTLMQRDRLILHKISLTSFTETPLHIAALLGHLQFTNALLRRKPQLVEKVDSSGRTALHLACAEGHTQVVKALLQANMDMCLVSDQEGRIPLHLAAMRGHVEVIKELLIAHPGSISRVNLYGDNVLHLCVRYNCLDALKLLVESVNDEDFVNSKDNDGNSVLHLAAMLGQMKTIKYLVSIPELKRKANAINRIGNTALDVSETCHRDFKCLQIQDILKAAGVRRSKDLNSSLLPALHDAEAQSAQSIIEKRLVLSRFWKWVKHVDLQRQGSWIDETRGTLMLVATVIATVTFQAGLNPPGGVWQDSNNGADAPALNVLLVIICGSSLRNKFVIWLLTLTMFIAIWAMALTYFNAANLVNPKLPYFHKHYTPIWSVVFLVTGAIHIIRLLVWTGKLLFQFMRWLTKRPANDAINA